MTISVTAKPNSKTNEVIKVGENSFIVKTTANPEKGKANKAILKLLSKELNIPISKMLIKAGFTAKEKLIEIK